MISFVAHDACGIFVIDVLTCFFFVTNAAFKLGLPIIPAYHNPATKGKKLLQGVNFASGGSGIQSYTGKLYVYQSARLYLQQIMLLEHIVASCKIMHSQLMLFSQGEVVSMQDQIDNLWDVKKEIIKMIGGSATDYLFAQAAYVVVTGSNDWLLSFFNPIIPIGVSHTPTLYIDILIEKLLSQVEVRQFKIFKCVCVCVFAE